MLVLRLRLSRVVLVLRRRARSAPLNLVALGFFTDDVLFVIPCIVDLSAT